MIAHICRIFFFNDTATTEIYPLSLHDALRSKGAGRRREEKKEGGKDGRKEGRKGGRKEGREEGRSEEQRLNSSHITISYAVFCLKKKKSMK